MTESAHQHPRPPRRRHDPRGPHHGRDARRAGRHRRVRVAPQRHRPRRPHHPHARPRGRPRRHARLHGRDERAGRGGAEARRVRQRHPLRRPRAERPLRHDRQRGARRGPRPQRDGQVHRGVRPARRLEQHRRQHLDRHHLLRPARHREGGRRCSRALVRRARSIVAAGYSVYGSSTTLVLSTGHGVHGFTLDPGVGEFFLSHPNIRCPERGSTYSINEGNHARWDDRAQQVGRVDQERGQGRGAARTGTATSARSSPTRTARCSRAASSRTRRTRRAPAASCASSTRRTRWRSSSSRRAARPPNGVERILDIQPKGLHDRTPLILGSKHEVGTYRDFMRGER